MRGDARGPERGKGREERRGKEEGWAGPAPMQNFWPRYCYVSRLL